MMREVYSGRRIVSDDFVYRFFVKMRQLLEVTRESARFPRLSALCDLMLHSTIPRKKHFRSLRAITEYIDDYDRSSHESNRDDYALDLRSVFDDIQTLLSKYGVPIADELHAKNIMIGAMRAVDGTDITCIEYVIDSEQNISIDLAKNISVASNDIITSSYGVRRWISETQM
jgi:hypothetical protein